MCIRDRTSSGEIVAVIALRRFEMKYPKAKTKNIVIAFDLAKTGLFMNYD